MENKKKKENLSDRGRLMLGWVKRIKHQKSQLSKTRKFHREIEENLVKRIRMSEIQLKALKKS